MRATRRKNDEERRQQRLAAGEIVPNAVYRERVLWLLEYDLQPDMVTICERLVTAGFPMFGTDKRRGRVDTSVLWRTLGMRRCAPTVKAGKRYPGRMIEFVPRELGDALYAAL